MYYRYLHEQLDRATLAMMMSSNPARVALALAHFDSPQLEKVRFTDANAGRWWAAIRRLSTPTAADEADPRRQSLGTLHILAERLTHDEKYDLVCAICELRSYLQSRSG
jgi:hypothetical protein